MPSNPVLHALIPVPLAETMLLTVSPVQPQDNSMDHLVHVAMAITMEEHPFVYPAITVVSPVPMAVLV